MAIQGLRSTNSPATDERPKSWREGIAYLEPNGAGKAPFTALTTKMRTEAVDDPEFNWWTKVMPSRRLQLNLDLATNASSLTVFSGAALAAAGVYADGAYSVKPGDLLMFEQTKEIVRVVTVASDTSISSIAIMKGSDYPTNTALTAIDHDADGVNPFIKVIGSAYAEGTRSPDPVSFNPVKKYNYTQIFKNSLALTNTAIATRLRTKEAVAEARREALLMHSQDMEMAWWFGERLETVSGGLPLRTTQGFFNMVPASQKINAAAGDYAGGMTWSLFEELLYRAFLWGSTEKIAWVGMGAMMAINRVVRLAGGNHIQFQPQTKEYGFNVSRLTTPFGTLVLWNHPLFNTMQGGLNVESGGATRFNGHTNTMAIMDMDGIRYRPLRGRDTKYEANVQENDEDLRKSQYITEAGIEWKHTEGHLIIENLYTAIGED